MKNKIIRFVLSFYFSFIFLTNSYSFDLNKVYNVKTFSTAKLEVNDTNLIDIENAESLLNNVNQLNAALEEKNNEIQKDNKDRKQRKKKKEPKIYLLNMLTV